MLHINRKTKETLCLDLYVIRDKDCYGYCCSDPLNLEKKLKIASQAGYVAVELWHKDVAGFIEKKGLDYLLKVLEDNKLFVASYKVISHWFEGDDDVSVLKTAASVNSRCCVTKLISDEYKGEKKELSWYVQRYQELLDVAAPLNISPSIEYMAMSPFMNKITDVYDILEKVNHPLTSLVLDTWHLWRYDDANFTHYEKTLSRLNPEWVGVIHFTDTSKEVPQNQQRDNHRRLPTTGLLNLHKFCQITPKNNIYSLNVYDQSLWNQDPLQVAVKGKYFTEQCLHQSDDSKYTYDSERWKNKQEERCNALWFKSYYTHLDPRIKTTQRDSELQKILGPILKDKIVLDFKCGFSPLAEFMKYGFDAYPGCIDYLSKTYPAAKWMCMSDEAFAQTFEEKIDVLLHIGIGDSDTEIDSHLLIREKCKPQLVVIECATNPDGTVSNTRPTNSARWEMLRKNLNNVQQFHLHTDMADRSHRVLNIGEC